MPEGWTEAERSASSTSTPVEGSVNWAIGVAMAAWLGLSFALGMVVAALITVGGDQTLEGTPWVPVLAVGTSAAGLIGIILGIRAEHITQLGHRAVVVLGTIIGIVFVTLAVGSAVVYLGLFLGLSAGWWWRRRRR